jgi:hypothetical protein
MAALSGSQDRSRSTTSAGRVRIRASSERDIGMEVLIQWQHTLLDKTGNIVEQHYRPMYKPRPKIDIWT